MKASRFEFRFRMWISALIVVIGFWSPWLDISGLQSLNLGSRTTLWLWLGFQLSNLGVTSTTGIEIVTAVAILVAAVAAWFRVWGTACLGAGIVHNAEMKAGAVMADGPYRYVRNPLYLGSYLTIVALSILMPPSGAAFTLVLLAVTLLRLILGEEAFLAAKLGEPYLEYKRAVPRTIPMLRSRVAAGGGNADWVRSLVSEIFPIGVVVCLATLSWQYNAHLMLRAILVCFGISLVTRAMTLSSPKSGETLA
jgi:protein-S-isoprenylcysteine O-methyltransferase Ste14